MKRSLAWSSLIGAVVYAVSTWLSADGVLVLGTALAAERASLSGDEAPQSSERQDRLS